MNPRHLWDSYPVIRWAIIVGVIAGALAVAVALSVAGPPGDDNDDPPDPASAAGLYAAWSE